MARLKNIKIKFSDLDRDAILEFYEFVANSDNFRPLLENSDFTSLELSGKELYTHKLKRTLLAAGCIERYVMINGNRVVSASGLAKIARISRTTLDRWISRDVFTNPDGVSYDLLFFRGSKIFKSRYEFDLSITASQLKQYHPKLINKKV